MTMSTHYRLEPLSVENEARWDELVPACHGREVFHRRAWLDYLASSRRVDARLWAISDGTGTLGYFCGGILRKGPFRILGSPLTGWGTNSLGPVFTRDADHTKFLKALEALARAEQIALIELGSPILSETALEDAGFEPVAAWTYMVDLAPDDPEAMWSALDPTCRNRIRKATRAGLVVEDTDDPAFVDEYYEQYAGVMQRKGMLPHYPVDHPKLLFAHLKKANCLFALRVKDPSGRVLATGLFPHDDRHLYFWGAASVADSNHLCPNDLLHWVAMRLAAKARLRMYNMSGHGRFKRKFGGTLTLVKRWHRYRWQSARWARESYRVWVEARARWRVTNALGPLDTESRKANDHFIEIMRNPSASTSQRASFRLADLWKAPLHHFPIRDEIVHQYLPLRPHMDVLEIGPGSGFTAFQIAPRVRHLSLLDIAAGNVKHLRQVLGHQPNLDFVCADLCDTRLPRTLGRQYDVVYALEVFELVPDPATALQNIAAVLRRGGRLVLQFPNYPPPKNPGVTYFETRAEFDRLMQAAAFEVWTIHSLRLRRYPQFLINTFLERPLRLYRRFNARTEDGQTLVYDQTWAFQHRQSVDRYKHLIHSGWTLLSGAMRLGGPCFERKLLGENILNSNLLVLAQR
jgi:SAM-dependent methyltransferase